MTAVSTHCLHTCYMYPSLYVTHVKQMASKGKVATFKEQKVPPMKLRFLSNFVSRMLDTGKRSLFVLGIL